MARKMKDSGIEWIGEIPEDWKILRLKHLSEAATSGLSTDMLFDDEGHYEVYDANNLVGYIYEHPIKQEYISIIKDGAGVGRTRLMPQNTNIIGTMNYITAKNVDLDFLYYIFQIFDFNQYSTGSTIPHIYFKDYGNAFVAIPNNISQEKISNFLNNEMIKIRNIYEIIKQQIQTLEDYKKSVITEAVTKGLDKNAEMKESGIEWIGEIPKHWEMKKIKDITIKSERGTSPIYTDDDTQAKVVNQATFSQGLFDKTNIRFSKISAKSSKGLLIKNDVLIASTGGGVLGKTHYFNQDDEYVADGHVTILRTNPEIQSSKIIYYFFSSKFDLINGLLAKGSTNQTELQAELLKNFKIPASKIDEQNEIADYLDKKTVTIDETISAKKKQLETLEEYKKSLIYEYVTGKKEVEDVGTI